MPTKEETSERLEAVLEEHEEIEEIGEALLEEEVAVEVEEEEAQRSSSRAYVILELGDSDEWKQIAEVMASTPEGAVRSLGEEVLEDGTVYAAVPARNFNVLPPLKKRTTLSF